MHVKPASKLQILIQPKLSCQSQECYKSLGGNLYCLVIVDDYSRYSWVFFLHDKSEVASCFKKFTKRIQNKFEVKLKKIWSDNGKEFDNTNIEAYCDEVGIKHEVSATYTQQNGVVEKKNQTLITLARTMLDEYNTPKALWAEAINTASMHPTAYFFKSFLARPLMSCSMERSRMSHSSGCLVANATPTRSGNT